MQVFGPTQVHGPQSLGSPHRAAPPAPTPASSQYEVVDEVSFSAEAEYIAQARELPEIRAERVAQIKAAIENGTYETDERLNGALDRLLDEIG